MALLMMGVGYGTLGIVTMCTGTLHGSSDYDCAVHEAK